MSSLHHLAQIAVAWILPACGVGYLLYIVWKAMANLHGASRHEAVGQNDTSAVHLI
jgi:TRAP-type C4-dicarboxylate transport system permease small subunit